MSNKRKATDEAAPPAKKQNVEAGTAMALGQNSMGQIGCGMQTSERKKPMVLKAVEGTAFVSVVAGGVHSVGVTADGRAYTWGCNDEWALGRTCVETAELEKEEVEAIPGLAEGLDGVRIVQASAGDSHTFVLAADGRVFGAGCFRDNNGALAFSDAALFGKTFTQVYPPLEPLPNQEYPPAVAISSGCDHVVLLAKNEGTGATQVFTYGTGEQGSLGRVQKEKSSRGMKTRGVKVPAGRDSAFMDKVEGQRSSLAALTTLLKFHPVKSKMLANKKLAGVFASGWSSWVTDVSGKVWCWGLNNWAQLGLAPRAKKLVDQITIEYNPQPAKQYTMPIAKIAGGQHHSIALGQDGKVYTMGRGDMGQLGVLENGTQVKEASTPKEVVGIDGTVVDVAAGGACSFAVTAEGTAYAWGFGENLQLTTGTDEDCNTATLCQGKQIDDRKILMVDAGGQHTTLVAKD